MDSSIRHGKGNKQFLIIAYLGVLTGNCSLMSCFLEVSCENIYLLCPKLELPQTKLVFITKYRVRQNIYYFPLTLFRRNNISLYTVKQM